ncbi:hypothetical protein [Cellulophaga baltica]|uniref:hypothetical protein n=1 Tax=Cellulophaga baltica TaxID=76594 RepID=UPI0024957007|nr:hypothetical protein [Cellulophaga baltica]
MKISQLSHYPNFVFLSTNSEDCFSTTDVEMLKHIKNANSSNDISSIEIGDEIYFSPAKDIRYRVENIKILKLWDDTDNFKYGIDTSNCIQQGELKEQLFKILVEIKTV